MLRAVLPAPARNCLCLPRRKGEVEEVVQRLTSSHLCWSLGRRGRRRANRGGHRGELQRTEWIGTIGFVLWTAVGASDEADHLGRVGEAHDSILGLQ
jgi:hypothetical protein